MKNDLNNKMFQKRNPLHYIYLLIICIGIAILGYLFILLYPYIIHILKVILRLLLPFIIASIIAYLLVPVIRFLNNHGFPNSVAILTMYTVFIVGSGLIIYKVYPSVIYQLEQLINQLPELAIMYQDIVYQLYIKTSFLPEVVHDQMDIFFNSFENRLDTWLNNWSIDLPYIADIFILLMVIPVLVFYFLKDHEEMFSFIRKCLPYKHHRKLLLMLEAIDESLGNYIRGQVLVCLFVGLSSWLAFYLFGLNYPGVLGIIMGITNLIPYFGPIIGLVPVVLISLSTAKAMVLYAIIAVLAIQIIENNLISPFIVGKTTRIHPVAILLVLLIGGEFFGIIGMIVAVPLLTIFNTSILKFRMMRQND